jgi:UDP-glucose 4-epimerase
MMNKGKILVTGGTGYIGSHTIIDLIESGYEPICVDNGCNSDPDTLEKVSMLTNKIIAHYPIDLCDQTKLERIFKDHQFVGIIHFAALKAVGDSVKQPIQYFRNNLNSTLNVLEMSLKYGVKNLIFSSSCTVYGNAENIPVTEETPWQEAESPYGRTKQMGEQIIKDSFKNTDHKAIILRYFNPAGAHISGLLGEAPSTPAQNLVPVITETAIGKRSKMTVFGSDYDTRDGSCIRDYIHVMDLARAHTLALEYLLAGSQERTIDVYNLGIGEGITVLEAINAFEKASDNQLNYEIGPRRQGDVIAVYANYAKANKNLGWSPKYGIKEIMETAWEWEKNRSKVEDE